MVITRTLFKQISVYGGVNLEYIIVTSSSNTNSYLKLQVGFINKNKNISYLY